MTWLSRAHVSYIVSALVLGLSGCSDLGAALTADAGGAAGRSAEPTNQPGGEDKVVTHKSAGTGGSIAASEPVAFMVPSSGGPVMVGQNSATQVGFDFPASAAGKMITLTPAAAADIGWPATQFSQVIKMEPDGAQFAEPIVIRPASADVIVLDFPSSAQKSRPEGLPLNSQGDGLLLSHFSTLVVLAPERSCESASGWQIGTAEEAQQHCSDPAFPTYLRFGCTAHAYCMMIDAHCCARAGASACHLGDAQLAVSFTPTTSNPPEYAYCDSSPRDAGSLEDASMGADAGPRADAGTGSGVTDAGSTDAGTSSDAASSDAATSEDASVSPDAGSDSSVAEDSGTDAGSYICEPNSNAPCDCQGNPNVGWHMCNQLGTAYSACTCPPYMDDAGSSDGSVDSGPTDGGVDAQADGGTADAGEADSGVDAGSDAGAADSGADAGTDAGAADGGAAATCQTMGTWTNAVTIPDAEQLFGVWGDPTSDSQVWAVGRSTSTQRALVAHYNGDVWTTELLGGVGGLLTAIWGTDASHMIAVGKGGAIYAWLGGSWSAVASPTSEDLFGVWGVDPFHYWVVGTNGAAWAFTGETWVDHSIVGSPTNNISTLHGVWGTALDNVWVTNSTGGASDTTYVVQHFSGGTWTAEAGTNFLYFSEAIWGASASDIWAVGYNKSPSGHFDGSQWLKGDAAGGSPYLHGVWGRNGASVWAVGDGGQIDYWNGTLWSSCSDAPGTLYSVVGTSTKLWAVGAGGLVMRNDPLSL